MDKIARNLNGKNKGFTLLELMVVMLVIAILTSASIAVYSNQTEKARQATNKSNIAVINSTADVCDLENILGFEDFTDLSSTNPQHKLVSLGYLKEVPVNPWVGTSNQLANYTYRLVKCVPSVGAQEHTKVVLGELVSDNTTLNYLDTETNTLATLAIIGDPISSDQDLTAALTGEDEAHKYYTAVGQLPGGPEGAATK